MISKRARKALLGVLSHSERILIAEFNSNPLTTVIVVYSPTNATPQEQVEKFYETFTAAVMGVSAHNFLTILGDFNAGLGPKDAPFTYHEATNRTTSRVHIGTSTFGS